MTEPQKMGVDAIWKLICARDFSRKNESQQIAAFAEKQLLDALTTIIEERDRAVNLAFDERTLRVTADNNRDALRDRVVVLERAVKGHWWFATEDGEFGCIHCVKAIEHPEDWNGCDEPIDFPHAHDCIVRTIQEVKR